MISFDFVLFVLV